MKPLIYRTVPLSNTAPDYDYYFSELENAVKTVIKHEDRFVILQFDTDEIMSGLNEVLIKAINDIWAIYKCDLISKSGIFIGTMASI